MMGCYLVIFYCAFAALGSFLSGFDSGVIVSSIEQEAFLRRFGTPKSSDAAIGGIVSSYIGGAIVGSLLASYVSDCYGRRMAIFIGGLLATMGAALQGGGVNIAMLIAGRVIAGLAIGLMSATIPVYCTEVAPFQIRGLLAGIQQWMIGLGILVAQWVGYGCSLRGGTFSWRFPLSFQAAPAVILTCGIWFLPESPRWLIENGREEKGHFVLARLRLNRNATNEHLLEDELSQIHKSLSSELHSAVRSWRHLLTSSRWRHRIILACGLQLFTQCTGVIVIQTYGPRIYKTLGLSASTSLMILGVWGALAQFWYTVTMLLVDKVGRRKLLIPSLFGMGVTLCIEATLARYIDFNDANASPHSLRAAIAMSFVFSIFFAAVGMISWIYQCEIFPTSIRARGSSLATAANWGMNLILALCSPIALADIGYKYLYCFAGFNWAAMILVWAFYPETAGCSLEEVEEAIAMQFDGDQPEHLSLAEDTPSAAAPRSQVRHKGLHPLSMNPLYDIASIGSGHSGSARGSRTKV